jgi:cysteine synthase
MTTAGQITQTKTTPPNHAESGTLLAAIGRTPLLPLRASIAEDTGVKLYGKWEGANPSGSLKDRVVYQIVTDALNSGELTRDATVVEASSGNTGIAMGMVGQLLGLKMRVYMPETKSLERRQLMRYMGVELMLTSGEDPNSHIHAAEALVAADSQRYFYLNQNGNPGNVMAHARGTAAEIWEQTEGKIDVVVASLGTSGTLMGLAVGLKERRPDIEVIGVEPTQTKSRIEGLLHVSPEYTPPIYQPSLVDRTVYIEDDEAIETARHLALAEGLFCGISSGAVVAAVRHQAPDLRGKHVVVVLADRADRYMSTDLFAASRDNPT